MSKVSKRVISFHYTLTDSKGQKLDSSVGHDPFTFMEGGGQIIPGLEKRLESLKEKDKQKINVPAAEAYGERDDRFIVEVKKEQLPSPNLKVGDQFQAGGEMQGHPFTVVKMSDTHATLDANHPLAGVDLTFDVEIISIREATDEELQHGHSHGPGGHHH